MTLARRLADDVARNHGRNPRKVAKRLNLKVRRKDLPVPHRELYVERHGPRAAAALAIARDAQEDEARSLIAHGIGHHLMHAGDRVTGETRAVWSGRHEREAEDFAALLLMPARRCEEVADRDPRAAAAELAELCQVTEELAARRLRLG